MFKSLPVGLAALTYTRALKADSNGKFRPQPGTVPWHEEVKEATWVKPDWDVNYFIPNFGTDAEIMDTQSNIKNAEDKLKHKLYASFQAVGQSAAQLPDLGQDSEIKQSLVNLAETEKEQKNTMRTPAFDKDFSSLHQADLGTDEEIEDVNASMQFAQKKMNHQIHAQRDEEGSSYEVPGAQSLVQTQSDPVCSSAGCTQYLHPKPDASKDWPKDYGVPNFGADRNQVINTFDSLAAAEGIVGKKWEWKEMKKPKVVEYGENGLDVDMITSLDNLKTQEAEKGGWTVPADEAKNYPGGYSGLVQLNEENMESHKHKHKHQHRARSDPVCNSSGCTQYLFPEADKSKDWPKNYPVPNYGMDRTTAGDLANIPVAEHIIGQRWTSMGTEENKEKFHNKAKDVDYNFAPELDHNIVDSQSNLANAEQTLAHSYTSPLTHNALQTETDLHSDPICNSAGCTQYLFPEPDKSKDWPKNYGVPNFGMDRTTAGDLENIPMAEQIVGHKWTSMGTDFNKEKFKNRAKDVDYNFAPALEGDMIDSQANLRATEERFGHSFVQLESDPICNSAGCTQYLHPKPDKSKDWPKNYGVPNFGMDRTTAGDLENIPVAEAIVGHQWTSMGTDFNKEKFKNRAKDVDYNFAPALESDMVDSANNLKIAEESLGHTYSMGL